MKIFNGNMQFKKYGITIYRDLQEQFYVWLGEFILLLEAIIGIITFGFVHPGWGLDWTIWYYGQFVKQGKGKRKQTGNNTQTSQMKVVQTSDGIDNTVSNDKEAP